MRQLKSIYHIDSAGMLQCHHILSVNLTEETLFKGWCSIVGLSLLLSKTVEASAISFSSIFDF